MADEKQTFKLDLDAKEFIEKALQAKDAIGKISDAEGLKGLVEKLAHASKIVAALGTVAFAFKTALDLTLEAEQVAKINKQFELLAKNAGVSAAEIREGLSKAVGGLADDTDVLQAANRAFVIMGERAQNLVGIMELARKVTSVMGGDLIQNFNQIAESIGNGNVRMLRSLGLAVDNEQALIKYAKATGQVVAALTDQERKQALANAVMEKGRSAFAGISTDGDTATSSLKKIGVEFKEIAETFAKVTDRIFGDAFRAMLAKSQGALHSISLAFKDYFLTGSEQAEAHNERLKLSVADLTEEIKKLEALQKETAGGDPYNFARNEERLNSLRAALQKYKDELGAAGAGGPEGAGAEAEQAASNQRVAIRETEAAKKTLIETKFEADLLALEMQRIADQEKAAGTAAELEQLYTERRVAIKERAALEEAQIRAQLTLGEIADEESAAAKIEEIRARSVAQLTTLERGLYEQRVAWLQQEADAQARTSAGFSAGFKAAAAEAGKDMGNFSKLGSQVFGAFSKSAKSSLMALGDGSKDAGEAMRGFLFGALADIAEAQGSIMIAQGFMGNFAAAAAGAGLLILAGFLRSQAQGATKAMEGATAAAGGGGAASAPTPAALAGPDMSTLEQAQAKPKREVTIQIQGHYLDTEGSRRALMEMIRQETDATSFKYVEIGQGA